MAKKTNRREFVQVAGLAASGLMATAGPIAAAVPVSQARPAPRTMGARFRALLNGPEPLVCPGAYDVLTARLRRQATVGEHAKAERESPEFFVLRRVNESRRGSACDLVGSAGIPAHPRPTRVSSILPMCNFAQNGGFWRSAAGVG